MSVATHRADRVDNAALRDEFRRQQERYGVSAADVAREMDWWRSRGRVPDSQRVERALGMSVRNGRRQSTLSYELAVTLATALDMDPIDAGV